MTFSHVGHDAEQYDHDVAREVDGTVAYYWAMKNPVGRAHDHLQDDYAAMLLELSPSPANLARAIYYPDGLAARNTYQWCQRTLEFIERYPAHPESTGLRVERQSVLRMLNR